MMSKNQIDMIMVAYGSLLGMGFLYLAIFVFADQQMPDTLFGLPTFLALPIIVILLILPFYFLSKQREKIRVHELKLQAYGNGWRYRKHLDLPFLGHMKEILNIQSVHPLGGELDQFITGKINGWDFVICDSEYETGGEYRTTISQTIFALNIKDVDLPLFGLEPETFKSKLHNLLADFDIDFASHPRFSKKFALYGRNKERIRRVFADEVLNFFEWQEDISVFANRNHLVVYRPTKRCRPALLAEELSHLVKTARLLIKHNKFEKHTIPAVHRHPQKTNVKL